MKKHFLSLSLCLLPLLAAAEIRNPFVPIELSVPPSPIEYQSEYYLIGEGNTFRPSMQYIVRHRDAQGRVDSLSVGSCHDGQGSAYNSDSYTCGWEERYAYDAQDNITMEERVDKRRFFYDYDSLGRFTQFTSYQYDRTYRKYIKSRSATVTYDSLARAHEYTSYEYAANGAWSVEMHFEYCYDGSNAQPNVILGSSEHWESGWHVTVEYHINYDLQGQISSMSVYSLNHDSGAMELGYTQTITHNSHGDITSETITYADGSPQNSMTWEYTYDTQDRMTACSQYWNGAPDWRREYYYADGPAAALPEVDSASAPRKTMRDGRIFIRVGDCLFDTTGRRVQ